MTFPLWTPFTNEWIAIILILVIIVSILYLSDFSISKNFLSIEQSRRSVHVIIGVMAMTSPIIFSQNTVPIIVSSIFALVNIFAIKYDFFRSIHATNRVTYGTIYFPISYLIVSLFFWEYSEYIIICLSILAFSDPIASLVGAKVKNPTSFIIWKDKKTIQGTISFFLFSFLLVSLGMYHMSNLALNKIIFGAIITSTLATASEITSYEGSDNITIPIISILSMIVFFDQNQSLSLQYSNRELFIILLAVQIILYLSSKLKYLSLDGFVGASIMSIFITLLGSFYHLISMSIFFVLSSILGKLLNNITYNKTEETNRNIVQVYANGGIPLIICIFGFLYPNSYSFPLFLASISAAMSDTWGTEFGRLSKVRPISILNFKSVDHGISGGITIVGTLGSLIGAIIFGILTYLTSYANKEIIFFVIICGFLSSIFDSILGASAQAKYKTRSGIIVENKNNHTNLISGFSFIDNSMVNFLSIIFSASLMFIFLYFYG